MFDLRSLEHSTILYETAKQEPLVRLVWNKQDPNYLATLPLNAKSAGINSTAHLYNLLFCAFPMSFYFFSSSLSLLLTRYSRIGCARSNAARGRATRSQFIHKCSIMGATFVMSYLYSRGRCSNFNLGSKVKNEFIFKK